jgi:xanthine dehydrogenase YagT iron-sulfur-binding subunit
MGFPSPRKVDELGMAMVRNEGAGPSRRGLLAGLTGAASALPIVAGAAHPAEPRPATHDRPTLDLSLNVNGRPRRLALDPRTTLLDALRDQLGLTGAKKGCDQGQCGACTVLIDGTRVLSCLTLAATVQGRPVITIEGLAQGEALHPMQTAFIEHDAFQCGYCTPGQILSAVACVNEGHASTDAEVREFMSGNICRCGAYPRIVSAIGGAASKMRRS